MSDGCDQCIRYGPDEDNPAKHPPEECPARIRLGEVCSHGRLKRQCPECELLEEVARLERLLSLALPLARAVVEWYERPGAGARRHGELECMLRQLTPEERAEIMGEEGRG